MKIIGIASAIAVNVALFSMYYIGLGQDQPANPSTASAASGTNPPAPSLQARLQPSPRAKDDGVAKQTDEHGGTVDHSKEVLDGKEVIDNKEVIDPKDDAPPVAEFLQPVVVPVQPQLPNTEFRPSTRKLGITSAPNSANLSPPVVSPESR